MPIAFDEPQQQAIAHVRGPMLVLAGAGTGKTTVLVERIARLLREQHAQPGEILAVSYTDNSAKDIRDKVQERLPGVDCSELKANTFHGYCFQLLKAHGRGFDLVDTPDLWIFLRRNLSELRLERFIKAANPAEFLNDLLTFCSRCRDELVTPAAYAKYVKRLHKGELPLPRVARSKEAISRSEALARCDELARVYQTVEQMLTSRNYGTFGDMIVRAVELLRNDARVLEKQRAGARFILIDEFQDSNAAQIELAVLLAGEEQNVFAVGDPDQAIYRFRGASSGAFAEFLHRFPRSRRVMLERNQRSTVPILRTGFKAISHNPQPGAGLAFLRQQLRSARAEAQPMAETPVEIVLAQNPESEAAEIAESIRDAHDAKGAQWKDFAVLFRQHNHRQKLVEELAARSIPFAVSGLDVLETSVVRDLVAVLHLLQSPNDPVSFVRVAALPQFNMNGEQVRQRLREADLKEDLAGRFLDSRGGHELAEALRKCRELAVTKSSPMSLIVPCVAREFDLDALDVALQTFVSFVAGWEKKAITSTRGLAEFLEYLDYFPEASGKIEMPAPQAEEDAVSLLTAHVAKGLEFKNVFVMRLNSGSFPTHFREPLFDFPNELRVSPPSADESAARLHKEEERRLFYVGITRARDSLTLCARPGTGKDPSPAGFLRDLLKDMHTDPALRSRAARPYAISLKAAASTSPIATWLDLAPLRRLPEFTLSATGIERYERCPLQFKIHYDWRLPGDSPAAVQFGRAMHSALKFFFDQPGATPGLQTLLQHFRSALAGLPFDDLVQRELYAKQGIRQLTAFHASVRESGRPGVIHTERLFEVEIAGVRVRGRVDRMDRSGDDVVITDYKTGRAQDQEEADRSLQLSIYALGAQRAWQVSPSRLIFHNLENNTLVETNRTAVQLHETEDKIREVADQIAQENFEPKKGFHCRRCAYNSICPAQEQRLYDIQPGPQSMAAISMKVH